MIKAVRYRYDTHFQNNIPISISHAFSYLFYLLKNFASRFNLFLLSNCGIFYRTKGEFNKENFIRCYVAVPQLSLSADPSGSTSLPTFALPGIAGLPPLPASRPFCTFSFRTVAWIESVMCWWAQWSPLVEDSADCGYAGAPDGDMLTRWSRMVRLCTGTGGHTMQTISEIWHTRKKPEWHVLARFEVIQPTMGRSSAVSESSRNRRKLRDVIDSSEHGTKQLTLREMGFILIYNNCYLDENYEISDLIAIWMKIMKFLTITLFVTNLP